MEQLFKRSHNVSYTIPVLNVTITASDITEIARIHSLNIGPLVALLFMGSIMTLVWFYLLVCVCCCLSRRGEASRGSSQVVPGAAYCSPTSPSSSASPLACKIELPSSSIERYDDEQRGNESKNMHRSRSLEEEHRKYSFKSLYIASIILSTLLGLAVVSIVIYQNKIDASARILMGDVENLILDSTNALCTSDASSSFCTPQSAGDFVRTAETRASGMLTNLVDLLQSLGEELYPPLNGMIDDLDMAETDLEDIKVYISLIMGNRSRIQEYNDWLFATSPDDEVTPLTAALPKGKLPNVTAEQLTKLDDHQSVIIMTRNTSEDVFGKIQNFMETDVPDAVTRFNTSATPGTSTQLLMKPLQNVFEKLLRARSLMLRYYALVYEQGERIEDYLAPKTWAVSVIFLLPFVLQIVFTILNRSNQKCSGHLLTSMCCSYLFSVVFLLLAIIFSLLAVVSGTVCEYHLTLLAKVPVQNVTINDVQLSFTPAVIEDILNCPSYPTAPAGATSGNNFISLLGGEKIFDITPQTNEIIAQVEEARISFTVDAQIQQSIYELSILENFTALDFANSSEILSYRLEIDALLEDLPPATMDRDDEVQRASLTANYLTNESFSWDSYQESLEEINAILAEAAPIPDGFFSSYTFQTVWNFTQATVEADSAWMDVTFVSPKNYEALIAGLVQMDPFTGAVNTAAKTNIQVHANLSAIRYALRDIQSNIQEIDAAQSNLRTTQTQVEVMFSDLLDRLNGIARNLSLQEEGIRGLASFADSAPDYTKCGFVGNFYREGFQKNFCGDLHNNLSISWPFMLVAASLLFLSFITFSCFLRKPKWYRDPSYSQLEDRNNLTPGRTPRGSTLMIA